MTAFAASILMAARASLPVDITIFYFRLNTLFWLTVAAVCGVMYNYEPQDKKQQSLLNDYFIDSNYLLGHRQLNEKNK
ncbi:MAG: hypothetical protein SWZ49_22550 [Cyanobacteriota bacterium]|nr:hypothetical protein [Cyanobacteriota bacterium]